MAEYNADLDHHVVLNDTIIMVKKSRCHRLAHKGKTEMEFNSDIMNRGGQSAVHVTKSSYRLTEGWEEEDSLQGQKMSLLHCSSRPSK